MTTEEEDFWNQPLATWVKDLATGDTALIAESTWRLHALRTTPFRFKELTDGVLLNLIFNEIEPTGETSIVIADPGASRDCPSKQRLFFCLLEAIRRFYRHHLNQLVVLSPPDIPCIVRSITPEESGNELNKFLLLLLGCAVQGERRKTFVERITRLAPQTQKALAKHIQRVTEGSSVVLSVPFHSPEENEIVTQFERTLIERDHLAQIVQNMSTDHESDEGSSTTGSSSINGDLPIIRREIKYDRTSPSPIQSEKSQEEMHKMRTENRRLKSFIEEQSREIDDLNAELKEYNIKYLNEQVRSQEFIKEASFAKELRDEVQELQIKLEKMIKLEQENRRFKEKQEKMEFLETKIEQLQRENDAFRIEVETYSSELESVSRNSRCFQEEIRFKELQERAEIYQNELTKKNQKIEELLLEQSKLENEQHLMKAKVSELERIASACDGYTPRESFGSLADQLEESERSEATFLRLEVQKLRSKLEIQGDAETSMQLLVPELEELRECLESRDKQLADAKEENEVITRQLHELEQTLSVLNANFKQATEELTSVRSDKEEAFNSLREARRKFTQFQAEFGKKFEMETEKKVRECEMELEQTRMRLQSTEDEKMHTEKQLERLREEQRALRLAQDELQEAKHQVELLLAQSERSQRSAEKEKNSLRERAEKAEDELETLRIRMIAAEDASRRLEASEKTLVEQSNRLGDVEAENRTLHQQVDLETKKTQRLREDLVSEKTRCSELISRLRSLCAAVALNGGRIESDIDDNQLVDTIDDVIMSALSAAKREADAARLQQHTQLAELVDLRKDIEKLRRSESASLVESDDRVRELGKENISMKEQVFVLQEKVRELQIEVSSKNSEIAVAKREIEELNRNTTTAAVSNSELARLQVSLRNLQLQEDILKQDNTELRKQLDSSDKSLTTAKKETDNLAVMHQALLADYDRLQNLHDLLTQDYDEAKKESQEMKLKLRNFRPSPVVVPTRELEDLRTLLAQERQAREKQMRTYADLQNEHGSMKREMENIQKDNDHLMKSCDTLSAELRSLKMTEQAQRATIRDLTATVDELTKNLHMKDVELTKLQNRIEMLTQLNRTQDEENKNLSRQNEMLMVHNKEISCRALNDKDQHHQELKDFQEKLSSLRRHKEKLEEKIMDQYRTMENKKFPDRTKQPLVKRAAKALIPRRRPSQPSSNGGSTTEDSSTYSADESPAINGHEEFDLFPPTCSSSEDQDRISPRYETIINFKDPQEYGQLRSRNDVIGGSVRVYPSARRPSIQYEKPFEERCVDIPNYLPPRAPVRNSSATASLRARPPPPPYKGAKTPTNLFAQSQPLASISPVRTFCPPATSTPKSDRSSPPQEDRHVVAEGERRTFIREKEERVDKAMSIYENVNPGESKANESTVWYEYGCV